MLPFSRLLAVFCLACAAAVSSFLLQQNHERTAPARRVFRQLTARQVETLVSSAPSPKETGASTVTEKDVEYWRHRAFLLSSTFKARSFNPVSPILDNRHVQTISGALLRGNEACRYVVGDATTSLLEQGDEILAAFAHRETNVQGQFWDRRERINTPDNDFYHVDFKYVSGSEDSLSKKGLVVFVHGLQSNSNSTLSTEMATAFGEKGFDVACINFRGCSGEPNNGLKAYNLGFTDDLKHFLSVLKSRSDKKDPTPIFVSGKSLGANVVLKALGELGDSAFAEFNVHGAAVGCVPFDNNRNSGFLQIGFSKAVYNENLLKSLKEMAFNQLERFSDTEEAQLVDVEKLKVATKITEFDDAFTAPLFGYKDHTDYYNQTSCLNFLDSIQVPSFILSAKDDPFMDPDVFPEEYSCDSTTGKENQSPIKMVRTEGGGHLGYMFQKASVQGDVQNVSFLPAELARFLNHVSNGGGLQEKHQDSPESNIAPTRLNGLQRAQNPVRDTDKFRENAYQISWTFQPRDFKPSPLLSNCHFQTISGVYLRNDQNSRYVAGAEEGLLLKKTTQLIAALASEPDRYGKFWDYRQRIDTPDGDFFDVDYKYHANGDPSSKGLVVIVHGLQSNSNSSLSVDMAKAYQRKGFDVACINFRGCSGSPNDSLRAYHLGFTDDLKQYLSILNSGFRKPPPIFLSGFSLGANVVLKALGELGLSAYENYNIYGAAVSGAPFDNERNIKFVQAPGFNKLAYNGPLLKSMKRAALSQLERLADSDQAKKVSYEKIAEATEISDIENALIAPVFGFKDNVDYYRKTNCIKFLDDIRLPTLVINAADDPFFDPSFFPFEKGCHSYEGRQKQSPVTLVRTQKGGHLGFMFHTEDGEIESKEVSFMPSELARYVEHVWERRVALEQKQPVPTVEEKERAVVLNQERQSSPILRSQLALSCMLAVLQKCAPSVLQSQLALFGVIAYQHYTKTNGKLFATYRTHGLPYLAAQGRGLGRLRRRLLSMAVRSQASRLWVGVMSRVSFVAERRRGKALVEA